MFAHLLIKISDAKEIAYEKTHTNFTIKYISICNVFTDVGVTRLALKKKLRTIA